MTFALLYGYQIFGGVCCLLPQDGCLVLDYPDCVGNRFLRNARSIYQSVRRLVPWDFGLHQHGCDKSQVSSTSLYSCYVTPTIVATSRLRSLLRHAYDRLRILTAPSPLNSSNSRHFLQLRHSSFGNVSRLYAPQVTHRFCSPYTVTMLHAWSAAEVHVKSVLLKLTAFYTFKSIAVTSKYVFRGLNMSSTPEHYNLSLKILPSSFSSQ